jgi:hypothetical protein
VNGSSLNFAPEPQINSPVPGQGVQDSRNFSKLPQTRACPIIGSFWPHLGGAEVSTQPEREHV